jgi:hypothetical protein
VTVKRGGAGANGSGFFARRDARPKNETFPLMLTQGSGGIDPDSLIPDQNELRRTIEQSRTYDGRPLKCRLIVKP